MDASFVPRIMNPCVRALFIAYNMNEMAIIDEKNILWKDQFCEIETELGLGASFVSISYVSWSTLYAIKRRLSGGLNFKVFVGNSLPDKHSAGSLRINILRTIR